jgi:NAD(P) transhydrogenase subunit alpha
VIIAVPKEHADGERRVALVPESVARLTKAGHAVRVEAGAGLASYVEDSDYAAAGAAVLPDPLAGAEVVLRVRCPSAEEIERLPEGCVLIGSLAPFDNREALGKIAARRLTSFALEFLPRTSQAQSMDVLSSMASIAGYKAVIIAAELLPKYFPMLTTAAGTVAPARVFVIGAGVAGLQAIATARRLGAVVEAFDVRPVVKEQVESLGARFVQLELDTQNAQDAGGYAKEQSAEQMRRQQELMARTVAKSDAVITTALIPGRAAPVLVTEEMVKLMRPGSVLVDLAAEAGGNCPLTEKGKDVVRHGVRIVGRLNLPSSLPVDASRLYSRNVTAFFLYLVKEGKLKLDPQDELVRESLITRDGAIVNARLKPAS